MSFLQNISAAIQSAVLYDRAHRQAEKGEFSKAKASLVKAYLVRGLKMPSSDVLVSMNILAAQILYNLDDGPRALNCAMAAKMQVTQGGEYKGRNRQYMEVFCGEMVHIIKVWRDGLPRTFIADYSGPWSDVSPQLRRRYPLVLSA
jgi:hypothetical protein